MSKKKPANDTAPAKPDATPAKPGPIPPGHLERCENQVTDLEYQITRAKTDHERRHLGWKLKHAKIRAANAKTL